MANEIVVGAERTLGFGDVYPLPSEDAPNRLVKRLKHEWNRVKDRGPSSWYLVRIFTALDISEVILAFEQVLAIWRVVGRKYSIGFLPLYLWLAFSMVQPYVASRLINFAGDPDASIWYGLGLVACDLVAGTMCLFGLRHYFYNAERMGLRVRNPATRIDLILKCVDRFGRCCRGWCTGRVSGFRTFRGARRPIS
jgi:hypothetical protein